RRAPRAAGSEDRDTGLAVSIEGLQTGERRAVGAAVGVPRPRAQPAADPIRAWQSEQGSVKPGGALRRSSPWRDHGCGQCGELVVYMTTVGNSTDSMPKTT